MMDYHHGCGLPKAEGILDRVQQVLQAELRCRRLLLAIVSDRDRDCERPYGKEQEEEEQV